MDPVTLMTLIQGGVGLSQMFGGALTNSPERPMYKPPQALSEIVNLASREANATVMPGQAQMQDQVRATTANAMNYVQRNSSNTADALAAASAAQVGENRLLGQLYQQNLNYKDRARARHMQALSSLSQAQNQAWQYNQQQPYENSVAAKSALFSSGMQTTGDALGGLGAILQANKQLQKPEGVNHSLGSIYDLPMGNGSLYNNIV